MSQAMRGGPLQGVRVLELTKVWAGPYAGKVLAYLGADVIRIESERSLDVTRVFGVKDLNKAPGFQSVNPEKRSVQIDMKTPEGIELILELAKQCDILIENLRPGAIDRLGLGYEVVHAANPTLVYVAMSMYGNDGPLSYQTGYAPCFAALGGISALVGYPDEPPAGMNIRYADSTFGTYAALGALAALRHARRSGEGQYVDVSAVESMSAMLGDVIMDYSLTGAVPQAAGHRHPDYVPHGVYPTADGQWLCIAVRDDCDWAALAGLLQADGQSIPLACATSEERRAQEGALNQRLSNWTTSQHATALVERLQLAGIPAECSQHSLDLVSDARLWSRGFFATVSDADGYTQTTVGAPWQMSRPASIERAAPKLGEHTGAVLSEVLGLDEHAIADLNHRGITR